MKCLIVVVISTIAALVSAEAPNYEYYTQYRTAPYLESGWRPSGPEFRLPARQIARPEYLQPPPVYGTPTQTFRPPQDITTTTELPETTTTELVETTTAEISTEREFEQLNKGAEENEKLSEAGGAEELTQQGIYYIYHPSGLLQRVVYSTKNDQRNMAYTAQLKYHDVEPIREPIYTYDPNTFVFQRLQF